GWILGRSLSPRLYGADDDSLSAYQEDELKAGSESLLIISDLVNSFRFVRARFTRVLILRRIARHPVQRVHRS
ncbi:MAG TPA: hypothetical protein VF944_11315, partial [Candidatus Bathyarchaeia archaeon]